MPTLLSSIDVTPKLSWLLLSWDFAPSVVIGMMLLAAGYYYALGYRIGPFGRAFTGAMADPALRPVRVSQLVWFWISMAVLAFALLSPLDMLGDGYLFSAHMIQHLILATVWPPLLLLSLPGWVFRPLLKHPRLCRAIKHGGAPYVALLIFNLDLAVWHIPWLYDLTLQSEGVHIFEHLTFMGFGLLVWWPLLSPLPQFRLSYPLQLVYLFANLWPMMGLGIWLTFDGAPLYAPYVAAPRLWGVSALADQQFGGLVMWMPGDIPYVLAMAFVFVIWLDRGESDLSPHVPLEFVSPEPVAALGPAHVGAGDPGLAASSPASEVGSTVHGYPRAREGSA